MQTESIEIGTGEDKYFYLHQKRLKEVSILCKENKALLFRQGALKAEIDELKHENAKLVHQNKQMAMGFKDAAKQVLTEEVRKDKTALENTIARLKKHRDILLSKLLTKENGTN